MAVDGGGAGLAGGRIAVTQAAGAAAGSAGGSARDWQMESSASVSKPCFSPSKEPLLLTTSSTGSQRRERRVACFLLPPSVITRMARVTGLAQRALARSPGVQGHRGMSIKHVFLPGKGGRPPESGSVE